jgi:hypothetical protein
MNHEAEGNTEEKAEMNLGEGEIIAQAGYDKTTLRGKEEEH